MKQTEYITEYYNNYDEDARLESKHGQVEFLTTMRYIEKYLRPNSKIIEIGAGTGRYSHTLANMGYHVDAVELVEHNIEIFKQHTRPNEPVTIVQGNALSLDGFEDNTYDITLLLGPMYHLFDTESQQKALSEAIRVTKPNGIIFAAYCNNDATIVQFCFGRRYLENEHYKALIDPVTFKAAQFPSQPFSLYRREDIDTLMSIFDVSRLHYIGTDMATNFMREEIDSMSEELFETYLRYHFSICERADMVGATHHMLDVFRKN
ncbi:MAG: methyltransferase domain-containing protein [Clostridiales bacterium]|nr:methyltransferase domain-containing protein [Clostridiales bacterium]